jgi:CHAT domain-containing protein
MLARQGTMSAIVSTRSTSFIVIAVTVAAGLVPLVKSRDASIERRIGALITHGGTRTITARLAGFPYGRAPVVRRGGRPGDVSLDLRRAVAAAEVANQDAPDQGRRGLAVAMLVTGEIDKAVGLLQQDAQAAPGNARVQNDLAAAYLTRAELATHPGDTMRALAAAERAVAADSRLAEAWFNRALALEHLPLGDQAVNAWKTYLRRDRSSSWSGEAREHVRRLESSRRTSEGERAIQEAVDTGDVRIIDAATRRWPSVARPHLDDRLLPAWAEARSTAGEVGASGAARQWTLVRQMATSLTRSTGDRLPLDTIEFIERAPPSRLAPSLQGLIAYGEGRRLAARDRVTEAADYYRRALDAFEGIRCPFGVWPRFYLARSLQLRGETTAALDALMSLRDDARRGRYVASEALATYTRGVLLRTGARFDLAVRELPAAADLFARAGDVDNAGIARVELAAALDELGEREAGWRHRMSALIDAANMQSVRARHIVFIYIARACLEDQLPESALLVEEAAVENALAWGQPGPLVETSLAQARTLARVGRVRESREALDRAEQTLAKVDDRLFGERWRAELLEFRAELELSSAGASASALSMLDRAITDFQAHGRPHRLVNAYLRRGLFHERTGNLPQALADLQQAGRIFESQWTGIRTDPTQLRAFERGWELYRALIGVALRQENEELALWAAERSRARVLLAGLDGVSPLDTPSETITRILPVDATVLFYASLDDQLCVWVIRKSGMTLRRVRASRERLTLLTNAYRKSIEERSDTTPHAVALHQVLLDPVRDLLDPSGPLVVIPAGPLFDLPFGALVDARTRKYVIEDRDVTYAPSLTLLEHATSRLRAMPIAEPNVLAVGIRQAMDVVGPLPILGAAEDEARGIASVYGAGVALVGGAATKEEFIAALGSYQIIHFAGHAVADPVQPMFSRLLFSTQDGKASPLFLRDIAALRVQTAQLMVLAACRTSAGVLTKTEGPASLGRALIAGGVPAVVGTLWDAEDVESARLLTDFHQRIARADGFAHALRAAQLGFLRDADPAKRHPRSWAAYTLTAGLIGAGAASR